MAKKTLKTTKKKSKKKQPVKSLSLEMIGQIYLVETVDGKVITKEPLDSQTVLEALSQKIEEAIKYAVEKDKSNG